MRTGLARDCSPGWAPVLGQYTRPRFRSGRLPEGALHAVGSICCFSRVCYPRFRTPRAVVPAETTRHNPARRHPMPDQIFEIRLSLLLRGGHTAIAQRLWQIAQRWSYRTCRFGPRICLKFCRNCAKRSLRGLALMAMSRRSTLLEDTTFIPNSL